MANVKWTARALKALDDIYDYLNQDAPLYADNVAQQIIDSVERLEVFPLSGRAVPEARRDDIREVIYRNYRIIYWVATDDRIDIISILHSSQDLTRPDNQPWAH
jgi:addiction module RelE/StbE family toxin